MQITAVSCDDSIGRNSITFPFNFMLNLRRSGCTETLEVYTVVALDSKEKLSYV